MNGGLASLLLGGLDELPLAEILKQNPMTKFNLFILVFIFLIFSCENKVDKENFKKQSQTKIEKTVSIEKIESISFRRTYVGHENLSDKELEKLYKSNPTLETLNENSPIVKKLNNLNLLQNADLNLHKFEAKKLRKDYLDNKNKIVIECKYDSLHLSKVDFLIKNGKRNYTKTLDFNGDHIIGIILQDIDDDNVKEILVLTNFYIMNGDNFILTILKYK
jgi:hypothetical protein